MQYSNCLIIIFSTFLLIQFLPFSRKQEIFIHFLSYVILLFLALNFSFRKQLPDFLDYMQYFRGYKFSNFEPGIAIIKKIVTHFSHNNFWFFFAFALISISMKFKAIYSFSPFISGSILIYFSNLYLLHECIQIRASIASSILLFLIYSLYSGKKIESIILLILAISFHYSSILFIFLFFIDPSKFNKRIYISILILCYTIKLMGFNPLEYFSIISNYEIIAERVAGYVDENHSLNIFSAFQILKIGMIGIFIYKADYLYSKNFHFYLLLKIYILTLCFFVIFSDSVVIASRVSELFSAVELFLIPSSIFLFTNRFIGKIVVFAYSLALLYISFKSLNIYEIH